jgi:hypothetical protein
MGTAHFMRTIFTSLVFCCLFCCFAASVPAEETPANVKGILEKSASFNLKKYPIGFWNYTNLGEHGSHMTEAEIAEWADAGFTVTHGPSFDPKKPEQVELMQKILDWCQAREIKLIVNDPRCDAKWVEKDGKCVVPDDYADNVRAAVKLFGEHPATFGFHIGDEPDAKVKNAFFECYRIQKEVAPQLHPFANLLPFFPGLETRAGTDKWPNYLDEYCQKSNADLICYDCYSQMNPGEGGWKNYFENLRLYREASLRNGVPFWNTALATGHYNYRCPNYDEFRWQFNTSVASGAHGVLWFFYYMRQPHINYRLAPVDEHWNHTQAYDDLRRLQKSFHRLYGDLFTRIVCTKVMFNPEPYGGGEKFAPDDLVARVGPVGYKTMVSEFVDAQQRKYVMLVNLSMTENQKISLTLKGEKVRFFSWGWDGKEHEGPAYSSDGYTRNEQGATLSHFLAPGQEAVYRVEQPQE